MPIISDDIEVTGARGERYDEVLTPEALNFLVELQRHFGPRRADLLSARAERDRAFAIGCYGHAHKLFEQITLADDFPKFHTLPGYERLLHLGGRALSALYFHMWNIHHRAAPLNRQAVARAHWAPSRALAISAGDAPPAACARP